MALVIARTKAALTFAVGLLCYSKRPEVANRTPFGQLLSKAKL